MRIILYLALIFLINFSLIGQTEIKIEREESISQKEFPAAGLQQISPLLSSSKKIHFYREYNEYGINHEVKLKHKGRYYSIEFDSLNKLKDIEQLQKWNEYEGESKAKMEQKFDSLFSSYKVVRFQLQVIPVQQLERIESLPLSDDWVLERRYEVEVDAVLKDATSPFYYELLFDSQGGLLKNRVNAKTMKDNLIY